MLQWATRDCDKEAWELVLSIKAETQEQFGIIIKQGREKRRLTQENLAELVEVDLRTIQRWEAEECIPWPAYVKRIVDVLPDIETSLQEAIKKKLQ